MKQFRTRLKKLRNKQGLSALALGKSIGVSGSTIYNWENNVNLKNLKSTYLISLAKIFQVSADYLLGLKD